LFNFKISGIAAGAAFVLSFVFGLFSGSGILVLVVRALIFAALFFALSCLVIWLTAQFLPELLNPPEDDLGFPVSGSRVDISVGDERISGAFPQDNSEIVDDIAGKPSTPAKTASLPLDQKRNTGYNEKSVIDGDLESDDSGLYVGFNSGAESSGGESFAEALPDMDGMTESSHGSAADTVDTGDMDFDSSEPRRPKSGSKKPEMAGDFNPKELAQAIRTVLKRDDKG
jgi:hypothetical protein